MEAKEFKELLTRYRSDETSAEENAWLETWYMNFHKEDELDMDEAELKEAQQLIWKSVGKYRRSIYHWRWLKAVAAIVVLVSGVYFFKAGHWPFVGRQSEIVSLNDIAPGKNTATVTFANGDVINLSDSKTGILIRNDRLAYNDGSLIQNSSGSHFSGSLKGDQKNTGPVGVSSFGAKDLITASTPRGGTYQVILPDGSKVWLNAASRISFPAQFYGGIRKIILSGEAYFEVSKDKQHPFVVHAGQQSIEVLGTHFNIHSYGDEEMTRTTLVEGAVKVTNDASRFHTILKPGQQAQLSGNTIKVQEVETSDAVAWKNGYFMFNNEELGTVMQTLARWYNTSIVYEDPTLKSEPVFAKLGRRENISRILRILERTDVVKFKVEGNTVTVSRKK